MASYLAWKLSSSLQLPTAAAEMRPIKNAGIVVHCNSLLTVPLGGQLGLVCLVVAAADPNSSLSSDLALAFGGAPTHPE